MKNLLYLALASAIFVVAMADKCPERKELKTEFESCKLQVAGPDAKDIDIMTLWQEHGSCIVKCMMQQFHWLDADGKIKKEWAIAMVQDCRKVHSDLAEKIVKVEQCVVDHADNVDPTKEKCAGYTEIIICMMSQFRKGA